jgi:hypothetical protein
VKINILSLALLAFILSPLLSNAEEYNPPKVKLPKKLKVRKSPKVNPTLSEADYKIIENDQKRLLASDIEEEQKRGPSSDIKKKKNKEAIKKKRPINPLPRSWKYDR